MSMDRWTDKKNQWQWMDREKSCGIYTQWNTMQLEEEMKSCNSIQSKIVQKIKNISNKYTK